MYLPPKKKMKTKTMMIKKRINMKVMKKRKIMPNRFNSNSRGVGADRERMVRDRRNKRVLTLIHKIEIVMRKGKIRMMMNKIMMMKIMRMRKTKKKMSMTMK
jgi:hypothetical protein